MSIPLNIDWQQILLHLFNFFILTAGLYFLLYKPVKDFMDKRTAYFQDMDNKAKESLARAEELKMDYESRLGRVDAEIRDRREKAAQAAEAETARKLAETRAEAEKLMADARTSAEQERKKIVASARQEIVDLAAAAAEKIVRQSLDMTGGSEAHEG